MSGGVVDEPREGRGKRLSFRAGLQRFDIGRFERRSVRDVESDRHDRRAAGAAKGAKDDTGGFGIVPDVEFRAWRDIPGLAICAAHDDESLEEAGKFGIAHDGEGDVGQGPGCNKNQVSGMGAGGGDDGVDGVYALRGLRRIRQHRVAESGLAVNGSCVGGEVGKRGGRPGPHGNVAPSGKRQDSPSIACGRFEAHVAHDRGHAEDARMRFGADVEKRERVVDSSVDVDDEDFGLP